MTSPAPMISYPPPPLRQPAATLRSLTESRRLLEEARHEVSENRERAQLRPTHTFSRLPAFFNRPTELQAIGRTLEEEPCFTVLFGASSVGKVRFDGSPNLDELL